ncbi:MAG: SDR family NAD(P)-dependent oxidoreductase [Candidatus Kapabacteria bacterium]|nr:SDR family NAD(P)-dependent oxidoreductase [Candidatus Kapabacteria bacterium]MDW8225372.1 SDR family NAD(P)-dependent oxidoreductase [Bacteroidota bacterium]
MRRVLIVGATSAIAQAVGRLYAAKGASMVLVGRTPEKLDAVVADLQTRGATVVCSLFWDARQWDQSPWVIAEAQQALGELDVVLIAHGSLPRQEELWPHPERNVEEFHINATSVIALLSALVPVLEAQRRGVVGVISSVAGERGRAQMAVYGAAKAAVTAFTAGVRGHLFPFGVRVLTIKPGYVDTPMTAHLPKTPLVASPQAVARRIYRALEQGKPDILYVPWWWRCVMAVVRLLPETTFKRIRI